MAYEKETEVPRKYSSPGESVIREDPVHLINGLFEVDKKLKKLVIKLGANACAKWLIFATCAVILNLTGPFITDLHAIYFNIQRAIKTNPER